MKITSDFVGGNIIVAEISGDTVHLKCDLRDTVGDWFYWAFRVEGAEGRTVTFDFVDRKWIGFMGAAKSRDLESWEWTRDVPSDISSSFTYTFAEDETEIYFAHHMLYHPKRFFDFADRKGLCVKSLCTTEKGRDVPYFQIGEGKEVVLLASRAHACESTGSYVLEGVIDELSDNPIEGLRVICIPFLDIDGVIDGDQGKNRAPHDHNCDYNPEKKPIYAVVREIRRIVAENKLRYAFDFHAPWHTDKTNFIPQEHFDTVKNFARFAHILEKETSGGFPFYSKNHIKPNEFPWNFVGSPYFGTYMHTTAGAEMSFSYETAYHTADGVPFTQEGAVEHGRAFARALKIYHERGASIGFTGDLLYDTFDTSEGKRKEADYEKITAPVWTDISDCDYLVANPETPFADEKFGYTDDRYRFNTPSIALTALKKQGVDLLTLANNHAMDRGTDGILSTLESVCTAELDGIGIYPNHKAGESTFIREIRGIRVAFVNYTYGTNAFYHKTFIGESEVRVNLTQPEETLDGSIHLLMSLPEIEAKTTALYSPDSETVIPYLSRLEEDIRRARAEADYVVMLLHSGGQYNEEPDAYTKMLCERIKEYGADIIIANHPHIILQSTLDDHGFFTAYCLGNLFSVGKPKNLDINPSYSVYLRLELEKGADKISEHIFFSVYKAVHNEDNGEVAVYNTFDLCSDEREAEAALFYANRFFKEGNYKTVMREYKIK